MKSFDLTLPENVSTIISALNAHGYEAYAVGGCVRDSFLGRTPGDWDITTSAKPFEVKEIFRRTVDTGIQHGTVTVLMGGEGYEVTTYRTDGAYEDQRHPVSVEFVSELKEDLLRRDFTINAMAYNPDEGLQDPFGGHSDLQSKIIRCVGDADARFSEDALRIMRAVRFSAQLDFDIEKNTAEALKKHAGDLRKISAERICSELIKTITSDHPEYIRKAYEYGITKEVFPEFDVMMRTDQNNPYHLYSVGEHTIRSMQAVRPEKIIRLTALFHDIGKPSVRTTDENGRDHFNGHPAVSAEMAHGIMRRLRMGNETIDKVTLLVRYHDLRFPAEQKSVRRALNKIGTELFPYYIEMRRADTAAQSDYLRKEKTDNIDRIEELYYEIIEEDQCFSLNKLEISGKDIIALGIRPGPLVGELLQKALEKVLDDPGANRKELLIDYIKELLERTEGE